MARKKTHTLTAEQRQARVEQLHEQLVGAVDDLATDTGWLRYLDFMSGRHQYSPNNSLLIAIQKPDATIVAAKSYWWQHGYKIRKGQKGIAILCPVIGRRKDDTDEDTEKSALRGFRVGYVWDVTQMEPREGVDVTAISHLRTSAGVPDATGLFDRLTCYLATQGITVERKRIGGGVNGYFVAATKQIVVDPDRSELAQAFTLLHETAHSIMHAEIDDYQLHRGRYEVEAESVTYVVAKALGMDVTDYSVTYVAGWADGEQDTVKKAAEAVQKVALDLLEVLDPIQSPAIAA